MSPGCATVDRGASSVELLACWAERDAATCVGEADRATIASTAAGRALVTELVGATPADDDLFTACAVLGRLMAEEGASSTLVSATLDHLADVADNPRAPWLAPARAALLEGYVARRLELRVAEERRAWEYPACAVGVDAATVAITTSPPDDDEEAVAAWADRVARGVAGAGYRHAIVSGAAPPCRALVDALSTVGLEVRVAGARRATPGARWRRWLERLSR